jgi:hypothetical protein
VPLLQISGIYPQLLQIPRFAYSQRHSSRNEVSEIEVGPLVHMMISRAAKSSGLRDGLNSVMWKQDASKRCQYIRQGKRENLSTSIHKHIHRIKCIWPEAEARRRSPTKIPIPSGPHSFHMEESRLSKQSHTKSHRVNLLQIKIGYCIADNWEQFTYYILLHGDTSYIQHEFLRQEKSEVIHRVFQDLPIHTVTPHVLSNFEDHLLRCRVGRRNPVQEFVQVAPSSLAGKIGIIGGETRLTALVARANI